MANLFDVSINRVPVSAQKSVNNVLKVMLGPDAANKINTLLDVGGFVLGGLNEQAADVFASKLSDAGASVSVELSDSNLGLFRVRLLSFGAQKIQVIKLVRDITGLGLKQAKELVESNGIVKDNLDKLSAVKVQQKLSSAGATAVVEAMSGTDSDEDPKNPKPLEDDSYLVKGKVSLVNGEPAIGLLVRVYDKDLRSEQYLGEASTLATGEYGISYKQEQFSRSEKNNADLLLRVFNEVGVELALKTEIGDEPDIYFNSPKKIEIDLYIEESAAVKASEYERLEVLLSPALDNTTLADLSLKDVTFLINETEINEFSDEFPAGANSIHFIAQSAKLSYETNIPAQAFYGWARMELGLVRDDSTEQPTLDLDTLLGQSDKYLKDALEQAIAKTIIPTWLTEQIDSILSQLQGLRDQKVQQEKDFWLQHSVKAVLIDAVSAEPLAGFLVDVESSTEDSSLDLQGGITNRQGELVITYALSPESVISTLSLVLNVKNSNGDELNQQEISFAVGQTQAVTVKIKLPAPVVLGEALQINALPISFSDGLSTFLEQNSLTNIAELRKLGSLENLKELPESLRASNEIKQLQAHVDLSLLSTHLKPEEQIQQNQFLIQKGFTHFITIADTPIEQFVSVIGNEGIVPPALQHAQASYLDFQLNNTYLDIQTGGTDKAEELQTDSALSCQCEDCVSALSPGAYLTDLIGYVTKHVQSTDSNNRTKNIDLDFLVDKFHQPLSKLPINCEATKTQVRQVRIACEVLLSAIDTSQLNFVITDEYVAKYRQAAYQSLLRDIGTSQFDIDRASSNDDIEAITNRLGIAPKYVEKLQLESDVHQILANALSEHNLERIFGLPAYMETYIDIDIPRVRLLDPLRLLKAEQKRPELYEWRLEYLKKQWKEMDFPESPSSENMPTIDPDVIGPDDFRHPNEMNSAFKLWKTRRVWVDEQIARIHGIVISDPNTPNGLETAISEISVATTLDDLVAQQELLANDAKLIEDNQFSQWLTVRNLSVEALTELAKFATDAKVGKEYSEEEWETYISNATNILVNSVKKAAYNDWILEETNISLNMTTFWPSLTEPKEGKWSLLLEDKKPLLDPEKVEPKDLPDNKFGLPAHTLWNERRKKLNEKQKEYTDILKSKMANRLDTIMIGAFGSLPDIESINTKLNSLDQTEQSEAKAQISALNLDQESFVALISASLILEDDNQTLSDTAQNNLSAALVSAYKFNFLYSNWITEEAGLPYWQSLKARLPKWQVSQSDRQQWQQALKQASTPPLIDPDIISGDVLLKPVVGNFAFDTWRSRTKLLEKRLDAIRNTIEQGGNITDDVIKPEAISNLFSEEKYLGISHNDLIALSQLEEEGVSINSRLQQISLARDAYLFLLEIAKRVEKGSKVLASTRENMYVILLQIWKVKQFATWREDEKDKLSLSPEYFKYPEQRPTFTMQQEAQKWRTDTRRQREWYRTLKARIGQQETLVSSLKAIVSDVEEQTLPLLRDALINFIDPSSDDLPIKAEKLTKQFLIGMQQGGCQMTTRVSMALEVLQTLVFSIRSGTIDIADVELALPSKQFEKEWKWMGSYATWKAAMGVFLYPEQILYPSLRRDKTPLFSSITESLKSDVSPENVCNQAETYSDYMKDLVSMKPLASCDAMVRESDEDKCSDKEKKLNKLFFIFAQGGETKKYYWSSMDQIKINNHTQSFWNIIPTPENVNINKLIGASSLYDSEKDTNNIYVFFEIYEKKSSDKKIIYLIFDSDNYIFLPEESSIELPEKRYDSVILVQDDFRPALLIKSEYKFYFFSLERSKWVYYELKQKQGLDPFGTSIEYNKKHENLPRSSSEAIYFSSSIQLHSAQTINRTLLRGALINILISNSKGKYYSIQFILDSLPGDKTYFYYLYYSTYYYISNGNGETIPLCSFVEEKDSESKIYASVLTIFKLGGKSNSVVTVDFYKDSHISTKNFRLVKPLRENIYFAIPNPRSRFSFTTLAYSSIENKYPNHGAYTGMFMLQNSGYLNETSTRLISLKGNPKDLPEIVSRDKMEDLTRVYYIESFHRNNPEVTHSSHDITSHGRYHNYLKEAYFFLPLQIALSLYEKQLYLESLLWFRSVFDFQLSGRERRLTYILSNEAFSELSYGRPEDWFKDPLNPHSIYRTNKYTSFTIQNIIRCLLDYADSEFTFDTNESVAKARSLYQTALGLIQSELPVQPENKCLALIEALRYTVADSSLQPYYDYLKLKLGELTSTEVLKSTVVEVLNKLNSNLSEEKRLDNALEVIQIALGEKKASLTATDIIAKSLMTKKRFSQILLSDLEIATKLSNIDQLLPRLANLNPSTIDNNAEIETIEVAEFNEVEIGYTPRLSYEFCIPNNPTAKFLLLRAEINLFKIRNCMNIAGMYRELEPYSAPIDVESALPSMGAGGQINLAGVTRIRPTQYRYPILVDRAKQLTNLAQQTEASLFSTLQSLGQEKHTLFQARQGVELSKEGVKLQKLRVRESEDSVGLAELQLERTSILAEAYAEWSSEDMLDLEKQLLDQYKFHQDAQVIAAFSNYASHIASLAVTAAAGGFTGAPLAAIAATAAIIPIYAETVSQSVLATSQYQINRLSQSISIALRNREYELQHQLAEQDLEIGNQQIKLANDRVHITEQEQAIAEIQSEQASDTVVFLQEKFTNVELYNWMSGVLESIFRYYLQQAAAMSKLAEIQLAFERQEPLIGVIKDDYYELPNFDGTESSGNDSSSIDRRGLTGSARLLRDITKLDQYAFTTDQRKQQLNVNFSLSQLDPFAFQQFKQTGVLNFDTSGKLFDRRFPGQYLRLIKQVRISVIALVPPVQGISATLTSSGISRVVIAGDVFQTVAIRRDPESIAFTNPIGASGVFDLNPNPEMLFPFEGNGVDTRWEFRLPKASNPLDFNTIADVLLTIEYTALHNRTYQEQVQRELDSYTSFDRAFSFRQEFSDAWYDLHNPEQTDTPMSVNFATTLADFPSNVKELSIASVLMYFIAEDDLPSVFAAKLLFTQDGNTSGGEASPIDGVIRSNMNGTNWASISGRVPEGNWQLELPNVPVIKQLFKEEKVVDILLVLTCDGELPSF